MVEEQLLELVGQGLKVGRVGLRVGLGVVVVVFEVQDQVGQSIN